MEFASTEIDKSVILHVTALALQVTMIYLPVCILVNTLYKKNSASFRTLLTGTVLTCVSLYAQTHFLDFQAIMTTGLFLYTNAALLNDQLTVTVALYALGLNVSLDVALMGPFLCYRLICKAMKQVAKEQASRGQVYRENILDLQMLVQVMFHMQAIVFVGVGAYLAPWIPYIWLEKLPVNRLFDIVNNVSSSGILAEAYSNSMYRDSVINEHSMWNVFFGDRRKYLENSRIPFVASLLWVLMTNLAVILMSRTNKQLSSHKKSMLQLVLCLQANFILGSPKM